MTSGWVDIISQDAEAQVPEYLGHPKLHDQIGAGSGQPGSVSQQAGSRVSVGCCASLSLLDHLWRRGRASLGHRWGAFPNGYAGLCAPEACWLSWGQRAWNLEESLLCSV